MKNLLRVLAVLSIMCAPVVHAADEVSPQVRAARDVIQRLLGDRASEISLTTIPKEKDLDVYEFESREGRVGVAGSSGVAMCRGVYDYLKQHTNSIVTWDGNQIELPARLPDADKTRVVCPNRYRHYFNVCTFGYTTAFWDWPRWRREIDWMALHGINAPLAMNGQEFVWERVWKSYGLGDDDLTKFFSGPAFLPWHRMGNINAHGGPLSQHWMRRDADLQKQILAAERELGMTPITPAFSGFVPAAFAKLHPQSQIRKNSGWAGFDPTFLLNPTDPLFVEIGEKFLKEYTAEFGTDHLYLADTFNEMTPQVNEATKQAELSALSDSVYRSILAGDPSGTWVMQGWLFRNDRNFWKADEVNALLKPVPDDRMILLDLGAEEYEVWRHQEAFRQKQWIFCTLHNYGQNTPLQGNLQHYATQPIAALDDPNHGNMVGQGITMEGIEQNAAVYELLTDMMWRSKPADVDEWLRTYARDRYGADLPEMRQAWQFLRQGIYARQGVPRRVQYTQRPTLDLVDDEPNATQQQTRDVLKRMLACADRRRANPLYRRDVVDVGKRWLEECGAQILLDASDAYERTDRKALRDAADEYVGLLMDLDRLLATVPEHRLSRWITMARACGGDASAEQDLCEWNARMQVTIWGGPDLHDYARKEWAGLTSDFYAPRWRKLFDAVLASDEPHPFDAAAFNKSLAKWEEDWCRLTDLPNEATDGDATRIAEELLTKYDRPRPPRPALPPPAVGIAVGKPVTVSGGTQDGHNPEQAIDGKVRPRENGWWASPAPQWLQIDLGSAARIKAVEVFPYWDGQRAYQYTVQLSTDGQSWTVVADRSTNTRPATRKGDLCEFAPVQARYVRVNMLHNTANEAVHLVEVRVLPAE